jgi:hypothetical protein
LSFKTKRVTPEATCNEHSAQLNAEWTREIVLIHKEIEANMRQQFQPIYRRHPPVSQAFATLVWCLRHGLEKPKTCKLFEAFGDAASCNQLLS